MRRSSSDQLITAAVTFSSTSANLSPFKTSRGTVIHIASDHMFTHTQRQGLIKPTHPLPVPGGCQWKVNWTTAQVKQCDGADYGCGHRIKHRVHFVLNTDIDFVLSYSRFIPPLHTVDMATRSSFFLSTTVRLTVWWRWIPITFQSASGLNYLIHQMPHSYSLDAFLWSKGSLMTLGAPSPFTLRLLLLHW